MNNSFYVYIIRQPLQNRKLTFKVGLSKNVDQRLKTLQGANSSPLSIIDTFLVADNRKDALKVERKILKMLGDYNRKGEWFVSNPHEFKMYILPEIELLISGLTVKTSIPTSVIAKAKWTLPMHKEIKLQQARLLRQKKKGTITIEGELQLEVITRDLQEQENLERAEGVKIRKMREAKAKAYKAKKLLEIGVFM
mgnify:FL=1|tara:strand:- start:245 stop:829 length:585 start_codon:yes stop_codon:yes gene_type:complete